MKKKKLFVTTALSVVAALAMSAVAMPLTYASAASSGEVAMYRLYNPNSGEHFYTKVPSERNSLKGAGWKDEGEGWIAPEKSNTPVYRLYNSIVGDHHYTMSKDERDMLVSAGWNSEGIGWYSDDAKSVPLYREYNPNAITGTHNYTTDKSEHDFLVSIGWKDEGIGWYGLSSGGQDPQPVDVLNSISLSETSVDLQVGKTTTLKVNYDPSNYSGDKTVTWTSSKTSVAKVDSNGVVTAASAGTATITASVNGKSASCIVNVVQTPSKSGFEIAKEYIIANGERKDDSYNYYVIKSSYVMLMSYNDKGNLTFTCALPGTDMTTTSSISFKENFDLAAIIVTSKMDDTNKVSCSAQADKKTYDAAKDTLSFSYYSGSKALYDAVGSDLMNESGNVFTGVAFMYWNQWLKGIGTNINDVGFPSYSGV